MTVEEIKNAYSMREIVERYGIEVNRSGFCKCPFHSEKTASMKIYAQSYYCFGCHAGGDVFAFVQAIEGVDFKAAFKSLGGTYDGNRNSYSTRFATYRTKAKAANCYSKHTGSFVPEFDEIISPYFKIDYHDTVLYVETTSEFLYNTEQISAYTRHIIDHLLH